MAIESTPLYLVRLTLDTPRFVAKESWFERADPGYIAHCQLAALFGELAPKPFSLQEGRGRRVTVLGYTPNPKESLRDHALAFANPQATSACDLDQIDHKLMPPSLWRVGRHLGFDVRICPIHRKANDGPKHARGAEVDVFLSRCRDVGPSVKVDREEVYRSWLAQRLEEGGASLLGAWMVRFQRSKVLRRTQEHTHRTPKLVERPDVIFRGTLEITDAARFEELLRRGIGRHRAFGFGMLQLRPPEKLC